MSHSEGLETFETLSEWFMHFDTDTEHSLFRHN